MTMAKKKEKAETLDYKIYAAVRDVISDAMLLQKRTPSLTWEAVEEYQHEVASDLADVIQEMVFPTPQIEQTQTVDQ